MRALEKHRHTWPVVRVEPQGHRFATDAGFAYSCGGPARAFVTAAVAGEVLQHIASLPVIGVGKRGDARPTIAGEGQCRLMEDGVDRAV